MTYDLRAISLGAGVQSTVVYLMAVNGEIEPMPDVAIFADTQWEPRGIYDHLDRLESIGGSQIPIHRVTAGNMRADILSKLNQSGHCGVPPFYVRNKASDGTDNEDKGGRLRWRVCTADYKIVPIQREIRRLLGYQKGERIKKKVQSWIGISVDEAMRMKDSHMPWIDNYYPLIERGMSRNDCRGYLRRAGFGELRKSACIGCPFHNNAYWYRLRESYPEDWADAVDFDHRLRSGKLPYVAGDAYLHRRMLPLEQAVQATHDLDQMDLFGNECEGLCGV